MNRVRNPRSLHAGGFTLVELMVVIALVALILAVGVPSFRSLIEVQRLRGVHSTMGTDFQFARSEAVRLRLPVHVQLKSATGSNPACYTIFTDSVRVPPYSTPCDCQQPPGSRCSAPTTAELRTVEVPLWMGIGLTPLDTSLAPLSDNRFGFDPYTGTMFIYRDDWGTVTGEVFVVDAHLDPARRLRTEVNFGGRIRGCSPAGSTVTAIAC
ncbi:MAG TPA: prepilin-type N-terminal cleavage/methylation domain-containing protein [Rubrivivax sp.]|nr:prepilin-type N-terminal cleavage/methylation domain-containing protein [Burkholderiales bacterium]HNT38812.1 prepilin-type N-terminal cleavage/methylation domain-containing protein [Rubrivivax sp.]